MKSLARFATAAVYANVFLLWLGLGILYPILPDVQKDFDVSYGAISWAISAFAIARLMTNLPAGLAGARYPRVFLLLLGSACAAAGNLIAAISPNLLLFLVGRVATGVGCGMCATIGLTLVLDTALDDRRGRSSGIYHGALGSGSFIGPGVGGLIASLAGWRGALLAAAFAATLSFVLLALTSLRNRQPANRQDSKQLPTPTNEVPLSPPRARYGVYLNAAMAAYVAAFVIFFVRGSVQQTLVPLIGRDVVGLSTVSISLLLMAASGTSSFLSPVMGAISDRFGRKRILGPAVALLGLGAAGATLSGHPLPFVLGVIVLGFAGTANSLPSSMIADAVGRSHRAHAIGLYRVVGDLGLAIAPVLVGWIADAHGFPTAGYTIVTLVALVLIVMRFATMQSKQMPAELQR